MSDKSCFMSHSSHLHVRYTNDQVNLVNKKHLACEQALLFGRVKRVSRERASERRSREGQRSREARFACPNRRACSQAKKHLARLTVAQNNFSLQWRIQGRGPGVPSSPLFLKQTEAQSRGRKVFFGTPPPPPRYLRVWMTAPLPLI